MTLSTGVEGLAEFHDVHTVLTQCWTNGWAWVGLAGLYLQLDVSLNLLSHELLQYRVRTPEGSPDYLRFIPVTTKPRST
ncbi:protein of unknown function [Pseudomonas sp. JV241A]|nr:protein of unknown function [Pseudomonas sp. JV241A]